MQVDNRIPMAFEQYARSIPNRPETYFKYVTASVGKTILAHRRLRWSSPLLFDDIFDVKRDFDLGFDLQELRELLIHEVRTLLSAEDMPHLRGSLLYEMAIRWLRRKDHADERNVILRELPELIDAGIRIATSNSYQMLKKRWSELVKQFRILCFSSIHDDLQMWSRYADCHEGAVLEFQNIDSSSPWQMSQPVKYQDSAPLLATKQEWVKSITGQVPLRIDDPQFHMPYILTKTTDWEYQKEWRVVTICGHGEAGLFSDYRFDPRELRSVYLGHSTPADDAADIAALLRSDLAHVQVFRGRQREHDERLLFDRMDP